VKISISKQIQADIEDGGWFNFHRFYTWIADQGYYSHVEVGSWMGHSAVYLAKELLKRGTKFSFYCVDLWELTADLKKVDCSASRNTMRRSGKVFDAHIKSKGVAHCVQKIQACSWEAADQFPDGSIDFIYIDADHHYDSVKKDLAAWTPKLKLTGMIAGHDLPKPGVKKAVNEIFGGKYSVFPRSSVWFIHRRDIVNVKYDAMPSLASPEKLSKVQNDA